MLKSRVSFIILKHGSNNQESSRSDPPSKVSRHGGRAMVSKVAEDSMIARLAPEELPEDQPTLLHSSGLDFVTLKLKKTRSSDLMMNMIKLFGLTSCLEGGYLRITGVQAEQQSVASQDTLWNTGHKTAYRGHRDLYQQN